MVGVDGDADTLGPGVVGVGLGAAALYNGNGNETKMFSQELEKRENKAVLVSV